MHSFDANTQTFEFHTILAYPDGKSLSLQWKEKNISPANTGAKEGLLSERKKEEDG